MGAIHGILYAIILKAGHLEFKMEQLFGMRSGISLKTKVYRVLYFYICSKMQLCFYVPLKHSDLTDAVDILLFVSLSIQLQLSGFANDLLVDGQNASVPPKQQSASVQNGISTQDCNSTTTGEHAIDSEDEFARSPHDSPAGRKTLESPPREFLDIHYGKGSEADAETNRYLF